MKEIFELHKHFTSKSRFVSTSKSIIPHLYEFFYHFDYTRNLMTS